MPEQERAHREHPSVLPWNEMAQLVKPEYIVSYQGQPDESLDEILAERRQLASLVAKAAQRVVDAIDRNL
jgi:hypothetical protein